MKRGFFFFCENAFILDSAPYYPHESIIQLYFEKLVLAKIFFNYLTIFLKSDFGVEKSGEFLRKN